MITSRSGHLISYKIISILGAQSNAYNRRLRDKPGLKGKITIKYSINASGNVINAEKLESTMQDTILENEVVKIIKSWQFCPINVPSEVVQLVYPFEFSQNNCGHK